jgi:peptidylprolyl isomerase
MTKTPATPTRTAAVAVLIAPLLLAAGSSAAVHAQTRTPAPAATAPAAKPQATPVETPRKSEVIARIGSVDVTADEVRAVFASLAPRQQALLARDPALLAQTVRSMLTNRLVLKEAIAKKWEQQPRIAAQLELARENLIVETYLVSMTMPPADYPNEAEVRQVYDANASAFLVPRQFHLAQVFVAVPKDADKAAEEKARKKVDEVVRKLKAPDADFAAIARQDSDEQDSADKGGEIGWLAEAQIKPEIRAQVVGLAKGATTEPIRLEEGWHLVKLLDTKASHTRPLAEVRDQLVQRLRDERAEASRRAYVAELLRQSPPAINELALSKLLDGLPAPSR